MRSLRGLLVAAAFGAILFAEASALADPRAELDKARAAYLARNYGEAEDRLRALLDPKTGVKDRPIISQARMNLGAVLIAEAKKEEAQDAFEKLILEDPTFEPDPLSFPGDAINTFIDVRATLQERIKTAAENAARLEVERKAREEATKKAQAEWLRKVRVMAEEEKVTVRRNRLVTFVPFGAGQFQNAQPVYGWVFLGMEAALVVGTGITLPMYAYNRNREQEELSSGDIERKAQAYHDRAESIRITNLSLVGAFVVVTAIGIVQANLAFVPESVEVKKRELPPVTALVTHVAPVVSTMSRADGTPSGVFVGLTGAVF